MVLLAYVTGYLKDHDFLDYNHYFTPTLKARLK